MNLKFSEEPEPQKPKRTKTDPVKVHLHRYVKVLEGHSEGCRTENSVYRTMQTQVLPNGIYLVCWCSNENCNARIAIPVQIVCETLGI